MIIWTTWCDIGAFFVQTWNVEVVELGENLSSGELVCICIHYCTSIVTCLWYFATAFFLLCKECDIEEESLIITYTESAWIFSVLFKIVLEACWQVNGGISIYKENPLPKCVRWTFLFLWALGSVPFKPQAWRRLETTTAMTQQGYPGNASQIKLPTFGMRNWSLRKMTSWKSCAMTCTLPTQLQ